eukprot:6426871-Lingulodinium_polyedra.AAC.1
MSYCTLHTVYRRPWNPTENPTGNQIIWSVYPRPGNPTGNAAENAAGMDEWNGCMEWRHGLDAWNG